MKENVGTCANCKKAIYCLDGFLDGVITDKKVLFCFSCIKDNDDGVKR